MKFRKLTASALALAMAGSTLMAVPAAADDQVTLRFSWWGGDERHQATLAVIEAFEKEYPNIHIEPEYSAYDGYQEKKVTEFASETAPDVFQIETGSGPEYYKNGVLYNISETGFDFSNFDENFLQNNGNYDGGQYALPTGQAGSALIVNEELMKAAGVDLTQPYDWEDLFEMGKKVREYDPECYLLAANTSYGMTFFVRAYFRQLNGLPIFNEDYTLNITEEQLVQCYDLIYRLYDEEVMAPAATKAPYSNQDQEDPNWIAGKYVADVAYTSSTTVLQGAAPDTKLIAGQMPLLADRKSDGWVNDCPQLMGIYAKTEHPEEAATFLSYFFNSEEAAKLLGTVRSVPPTKKFQDICEAEGTMTELDKMASEVSMQYNGKSDSGLSTSAEVVSIFEDAYEALSYGEMTAEEAAAETWEQLDDFISRNA